MSTLLHWLTDIKDVFDQAVQPDHETNLTGGNVFGMKAFPKMQDF